MRFWRTDWTCQCGLARPVLLGAFNHLGEILMTLREKIQAQIDAHKAEIATLEAHLAAGGTWLEQEINSVEEWFKALIAKIRGVPPPPPAVE